MCSEKKNVGIERINFKNFVTFLCMFENYYNLFEFGTGLVSVFSRFNAWSYVYTHILLLYVK